MKNKAVFFDLDGTLFDTAPDLYASMCVTIKQFQGQLLSYNAFRPHVHTGTHAMLKACFSLEKTDTNYHKIRQHFLDHYAAHLTEKTRYFIGMDEVLNHLDQASIPWGIVTNKPENLTHPLLQHYGLEQRAQCIIGGDTLTHKKPHPEPLLHACKLLNVLPEQATYVGDTESDMAAAHAAGMRAIAALYGYRPPNSHPSQWSADYWIDTPLDVLKYL